MGHAVLTFENAHHRRGRRLVGALRSKLGQHPLKLGDHWHVARLSVLRCGHRIAADMQFSTGKVHARPRHALRLAEPCTPLSKKTHEALAIFRPSRNSSAES